MSHNVTEGEEIHPKRVAEVSRGQSRSCSRQGFQGTARNVKQEQQVMGLSSFPVLPRPKAGPHASEALQCRKAEQQDRPSRKR